MATVTLSDLWVHDASDLDTFVKVYMGSLTEVSNRAGEVRAYANGVFRAITSGSPARTYSVELPFLSRADLTTLRGWVGRPVMVRDPLGRKVFGTFFSVEASETPIGDIATVLRVSLQLYETSATESV